MTASNVITRRRFLYLAGTALGASALTCSALAAAKFARPGEPDIHWTQTTYGDEKMLNDRILVTYASQAGSTMSVAEAIGKTLAQSGLTVDVLRMQDVKDLTPYRAVVAGSAIHGAKWLPEAMQFLRDHQPGLARVPFAAFLVCITLGMKNAEKYRDGVATWMAPVRALVRPRSEGLFAGDLDFSRLPVTPNILLMRAAVAFGALPKGDYRDWSVISAWAAALPAVLS
jgi:menaquinone-dependent protoporphyrinogen oxidase